MALLEEANSDAEAAREEAEEAAAEAAAIAAEVDAAEQAVNTAYTTKPVIEGAISLEDQIKEAYMDYSEMKIALSKDKENLDLQYKVGYLYTRYTTMNDALAAAEEAEREANPAMVKAAEDAAARAAREAEKAAALPAEEKLALLNELADAMASTIAETAVPELLRRESAAVDKAKEAYKDALRDPQISEADKLTLDAAAQKAQKRYLALKEQVKMEEDKKAAALQLALENAQELEDERNAVTLDAATQLEIVQYVQELTIVEATGDEEADLLAREAAL